MKRLFGFLFVLLALGIATPTFAWNVNDSAEPGSVLVFHKFIRGIAPPFAKTEIEISVTCPNGSTCMSSGQAVKLHAHWVCPGNDSTVPFTPCSERDFHLTTTVNGSIKFDPENFETTTNTDTVPQPPCPRGYLIAWVVDDFDNPIKFDGLIGDGVLHDSNGTSTIDVFYLRAYNALPIQADPALNTGDFTDLDSLGNHTGALQFDSSGSHYQAITGRIFGTVKYDTLLPAVQHTFLTLLTLDVQSNRFNNPTFVDLNFYNEKEVLKSEHTNFVCWEEVPVTSIDNTLISTLFGNKGLVQSTRAEKQGLLGISDDTGPVTLVGILETVDNTAAQASSAAFLFDDSNPVPTTFYPNDSTSTGVVPW
jgi:hypothetical protein